MADEELVSYLYNNVSMGLKALNALIASFKNTDNKIKSNVLKSQEIYEQFLAKCNQIISDNNIQIKQNSTIASIMTVMGTKMEFMRDNSDSKIADTLIQGYNMGIIDITKKMKKYKKDASKAVYTLCEDYKQMMQQGIKDIKGFL